MGMGEVDALRGYLFVSMPIWGIAARKRCAVLFKRVLVY